MPSRSPLPTTGMLRWRLPGCRRASTSMSRSPAATILPRARMLVEAQQKYRKLVQMGTQQRSSPHTIEIVDKIHNGLIGRAYFAKAWYSNVQEVDRDRQGSAGAGAARLGSCGRARRRAWPIRTMCSRTTGTGSRPGARGRRSTTARTRSMSAAGRWASTFRSGSLRRADRYQFKDDWQFYDTLMTSFDYDDKMISWEGKCCNGMKYYNRDRGSTIVGTTGTRAGRSRWL